MSDAWLRQIISPRAAAFAYKAFANVGQKIADGRANTDWRLRMAVHAVAREFLPQGACAKPRVALRVARLQFDRAEWLVLFAAMAHQLRPMGGRDARGFHLRDQGQPLHQPHAEAAQHRDGAGELLRVGSFRAGRQLGPILWQFPAMTRFNPEVFEEFFRVLPRSTAEAMWIACAHDERPKGRVCLQPLDDFPLRYA